MKNINWIYLSYELSSDLSSYGNGERINISRVNRIEKGKSSNTSLLTFSSHFGTHIDYPYHFSNEDPNGDFYSAKDYIFENIRIIDISQETIPDLLIKNNNFLIKKVDNLTELLIIKTNFGVARHTESYWKYNWGFSPETAAYLKTYFPNLRAIGFDLISLTSFQRRDIGRIAHKEFLINNKILIIEDMNLSNINKSIFIKKIIISPLRFAKADGAPVTIFANIESHD
ncbi:MAG: cyclase family protein [Bacteroidales bacterium]|nr:cyclase family protein [Bacteroidales bacterium]